MKQLFAWAIVTDTDKLAVFTEQCPIYWQLNIAQRECNRRTKAARDDDAYHVEKVTVLAVYR